MRKPKTPGDEAQDDTPPGGHAKDRARHFAQQRGLPTPPPDGVGAGLPDEPAAPATPPPPQPTTKKR